MNLINLTFATVLMEYLGMDERQKVRNRLCARYGDRVPSHVRDKNDADRREAPDRAKLLIQEEMLRPSLLDKIQKDEPWVGGTLVVPFHYD